MAIDWDAWRRGWRGAKRRGQQIEGPCPITGEGDNACHVNLQDDCAGCRKCGNGSGRLTGDQLVEHARAAGAVEVDLGAAASGAWESWTWTTVTGRERKQYRTPDGPKVWQTKGGPHPGPADLMYCPAGVPSGPGPIYLTEGASDADAAVRAGLPAIGRNNARPSAESLARLDSEALYRLWPDHDSDAAGYRQAVTWHAALTAAGLSVEVIDPTLLHPDTEPPDGYDARDWLTTPPADIAAALAAAVVDIKTIRARVVGTVITGPPDPDRQAPPIVAYSAAGLEKALEHLRIDLRFNLRSKIEEIRRDGEQWERLTGGDRDVLRADLFDHAEFPPRGKDADSRPAKWAINELRSHVGAIAYGRKVDPFLDWVRSLPQWDRTPRLDTWLPTVLPVAVVDPEYLAWCSRSVVLAAVQRAVRPGLKHDHVVTLIGGQGAHKSTVWRLLFPDWAQHEWFSDGLDLREERKSMSEAIQGRVIVEVSELVTRRTDLERVKAWVRQIDDGAVRLAYRSDPEPSPRRFVIVATSNRDDCLPDDPTGNRAFSPVRVGEADGPMVYRWMGAARDQLWAEAWVRRDEPAWMQKDMERGTQRRQADLFRARNVEAEDVIDAFMATWPGGPFRMQDVIASLPEDERAAWKRDARELGRVLDSRGWAKRQETIRGIRATWWQQAKTKRSAATLQPCATLTSGEYKNSDQGGRTVLPTREDSKGCRVAADDQLDFPAFGLGRADGGAVDQGPGGAGTGPEISGPPLPAAAPVERPDPTLAELQAAAKDAAAELILDTAGRPIWWREPDGALQVAVETPAPPPGDPDPSGDACSRCGRPWPVMTGPGYCSRCDGGEAWDDDDRERRLRRLETDDLRVMAAAFPAHGGRVAELAIIRDELDRRWATESDGARVH